MFTSREEEIYRQKSMLKEDNSVELAAYCGVNSGIIQVDDQIRDAALNDSRLDNLSATLFVPASGVGSRMFTPLNDFLETKTLTKELGDFFEALPKMALGDGLIDDGKIETRLRLARHIIEVQRLNQIAKGLIPFHRYDNSTLNAFQEQVKQCLDIPKFKLNIHFTIDESQKEAISKSIKEIDLSKGRGLEVGYSHQDSDTDAYCFDVDGDTVLENGAPLRRPAGHGALLKNLNEISDSLILVKNIDNVQHSSKNVSGEYWLLLTHLILEFKEGLISLAADFNSDSLKIFNARYQVFMQDRLGLVDKGDVQEMLDKPIRICGMVKNEGAPGGGPFWVAGRQGMRKQIVEKSQVTSSLSKDILSKSSHFNPVFMVLSKINAKGGICNLLDYRDDSTVIRVKKDHRGKEVIYHELPGLWNGSMSDWNTIFVELPLSIFSPVKVVNDLMGSAHTS